MSANAQEQLSPPPAITIDGRGTGRSFDGLGALSAGASSRLLYDYPEPERSQILDYLFKPNYGASLHILKVEIGGDSNTTAGSEPSHMRWPGDLNGERGYEWWLMKEAKKRNPDIKLWGLQWCAPGWLKGGFWSQDNIDYLLAWLRLAQQQGLKIDYMGGWNERGVNAPWYSAWHQALAQNFPDIKVVAADDGGRSWKSVQIMVTNSALREATDIIGVHDPYMNRTGYEHCPVPDYARQLNKTIWDSELSDMGHDVGAVPMARALNRQYIEGRLTANIAFSLISAWYADLPIADTGLMLATCPWSGYYHVGKNIWVQAHTAQFTRIGWQYLDSGCGYLSNGTSYVSLRSPDGRDFTTVIETVDALEPQTVTFQVTGGLSAAKVQLWSTDLASDNTKEHFVHQRAVRPKDGVFSLTLEPHHVYTLSTTTGQAKGSARPKAGPEAQLPLPYKEDFESYGKAGKLARYFSDLEDAFETAPCGGGRTGWCYRQVITNAPIAWEKRYARKLPPTTLMGDSRWWGDYEAGVDVLLEQPGYIELLGRVSVQRGVQVAGYHFQMTSDGNWTLYSEELGLTNASLASGTAPFSLNHWHRLGLRMLGKQIAVLLDGQVLRKLRDERHLTGKIGLRVSRFQNAQFDNVSVAPTGPWPRFVPHAQMKVIATSQHADGIGGYDYLAANAIDDRPETAWSAEWNPRAALPQFLTLDLGRNRQVHGLVYQPLLPRIWAALIKGNEEGYITAYRIWLSRDGKTFAPAAQGTWPANCSTKFAAWSGQKARYVRLEAIQAAKGSPMVGEINISTTPLGKP